MYRHGYFRQRIDASGWQHEYWVETDPDRVPAALVTGDDGLPVTVTVPIGDREVVAQIWRVDVGRVPLLLLDADRPENDLTDRWITSRLYVGDPGMRLGQYALLGIGGVRALHALGIDPASCTSTRATPRWRAWSSRAPRAAGGGSVEDAFEAVRRRDRVHDPHAGAGGQRHVPGRADGRGAGRHRPRAGLRPGRRSCAAAARTSTRTPSRSA